MTMTKIAISSDYLSQHKQCLSEKIPRLAISLHGIYSPHSLHYLCATMCDEYAHCPLIQEFYASIKHWQIESDMTYEMKEIPLQPARIGDSL